MSAVELEAVSSTVTILRLNRPDRLNAINFNLVSELHAQLDVVATNDECRVVILTGAGRAFCSGLDLQDWGQVPDVGASPHRKAGSTGQSFLSSLASHIRATPQIVLAAVNGPAYGGGFALSLACDLRVASSTAEILRRLHTYRPYGNRCRHLILSPAAIGASRAFDLMVTGRSLDAEEALEMGIVSRVIDDATFDQEVDSLAGDVAGFTSVGLRMTKEVMWANLDTPSLDACLALENRNQDIANKSEEVREYMSRYRDRITSRRN